MAPPSLGLLSIIGPNVPNVWMDSGMNATHQLLAKFNHNQGRMVEFGPTEFADRLFFGLPLLIFSLPFLLLGISHAWNHQFCSFHDPFYGFDRKTCWTTL